MNLERRTITNPIEFREEGDRIVAVGLGVVYNKRSQNLGGFVETVRPGSAKKTVLEADVRAAFNHDPNLLLGRKGAGTLRLEETDEGVRYEIDLPNTTVGRDVAELLRRGDIIGSSMGFRAIADEWGETEDGFPLRTLTEIALRDIGPVTFPAYTDTDATLESLAAKRSLDLVEVRAAAEQGRLIEIIRGTPSETIADETDGEERRTTSTFPASRRLVRF